MKRKTFRVLSAVMSVIMFIFAGITPLSVFAEGEINGNAVLSITSDDATINGVAIVPGQQVHDGDVLALNLKWSLSDDTIAIPATIVYDMSHSLKGISIINGQRMPAVDGNGNTIATYEVSGQNIIIKLLEGMFGRSGSCELSGVIDLSSVAIADNGDFDVKYFDKTITLNAPDTVPSLSVSKYATNFRRVGDKYYQDFEVKVQGANNATAKNVSILDVFPTGSTSVYTGGILNATVNGAAASVSYADGGSVINIGTVNGTTPVIVKYSIEINGDNIFNPPENTTIQSENKAKVRYNGTESGFVSAWPSYYSVMPGISKEGSYDAVNKEITWIITVSSNILADKNFVITDTLDSKLSFPSGIAGSVSGKTLTLSKNDLIDLGNGKYQIQYKTSVADDYATSAFPVNFTNKAKVEYPDLSYSCETSKTITTPPLFQRDHYITKKALNANGNKIPWEMELYIPDVDGITSVKLQEDTTGWAVNMGEHIIDLSSFKIYGKNGAPAVNGTDFNIASSYNPQHIMFIELTTTFIEANRGGNIKIYVDTVMQNESSMNYKNTVNVEIKSGDSSINDKAEAIYTAPLSSEKGLLATRIGDIAGDTTGKINPMAWYVNIKGSGHTYNEGDEIKITDTIPDGLTYIAGSAKLAIPDSPYWQDYSVAGYQSQISAVVSGQVVTFTVTINSDIKAKLNGGGYFVSVAYATEMTKEYAAQFNAVAQTKNFTNSAKVKVGDTELAEVNATQTIVSKPDNIIHKGISAQGVNGESAYASYVIDVNKDKLKIGSGATITVTDKLGSRLTLTESSIVITPNDGVAGYRFDSEANSIVFTLKNETCYKIEYGVKVKQIGKNETYSDEQISAMFANTVKVSDTGADNTSSVALVNNGTYRSAADYVFNLNEAYIQLNGTKYWDSDADSSVIPSSITIVITRTKNGVDDTGFIKTYNVSADSTGKWNFTTERLITKDTDANIYKYIVSEQSVDGFTASYKLDGENLDAGASFTGGVVNSTAQQMDLKITNTYTPKKSLKVNKKWAGSPSSSDKPSVITITLRDVYGGSYTKDINIAGGETYAVFDNLPVYKCSMVSGSIVKTPIKYYLEESASSAADSTLLSKFTFQYHGTDDTVSGKRVFTLEESDTTISKDIHNVFNGGGTTPVTTTTTTTTPAPVVTTTTTTTPAPVVTTTTTTTPAPVVTTTTTTTTAPVVTTTTTTTPAPVVTTTTTTTPAPVITTSTTTTTIPVITTSSQATTTTTQPVVTTTPVTTGSPVTVTASATTTTTSVVTVKAPETIPSVTTTLEATTTTQISSYGDEDEIPDEEVPDEEIPDEEIPDEDEDTDGDSFDDDDSSSTTGEGNPNTGVLFNWQLLAGIGFGLAAIAPAKKKKK